MNCPCGKGADILCRVYSSKGGKLMCYPCAYRWLIDTAKCPKCNDKADVCGKSCKEYKESNKGLTLDRGIVPIYVG